MQQRKARYWGAHIEQWRESGLSQAEYCRRMDLSKSSFGYWRRRFAEAEQHTGQATEVVLVPMEARAEPEQETPLQLYVGEACRIELTAGFRRQTLRDVLAALVD